MKTFNTGTRSKTEVVITDGIMAIGKSSKLIETLNAGVWNGSANKECYLIIVPYLEEVQRYIDECPELNFTQPDNAHGTKSKSLLRMLQDNRNIVTTHKMFELWSEEIRDAVCFGQYNIIIDEEVSCVEPINMTAHSKKELLRCNYITVDEETGQVDWDFSESDDSDGTYNGSFPKIRRFCKSGSVFFFGSKNKIGEFMIWNLPTDFFEVGKTLRVMTFRFKFSIIRCYLDFHKMPYRIEYPDKEVQREMQRRAAKHIKFLPVPKVIKEMVKGTRGAMSVAWYGNRSKTELKAIGKAVSNYLSRTAKVKADDLLCTYPKSLLEDKSLTIPGYKNKEEGEGPWIACNTNGTNKFSDRHTIAYLHNIFPNVVLHKFFVMNGIRFDQEEFALSTLLQYIWRTAIRLPEPEDIQIMLPSLRMHKLLQDWIDAELRFDEEGIMYKLVDPQGEVVEFANMADFCMVHDLDKTAIRRVLNGERKSHKRYRLELDATEDF